MFRGDQAHAARGFASGDVVVAVGVPCDVGRVPRRGIGLRRSCRRRGRGLARAPGLRTIGPALGSGLLGPRLQLRPRLAAVLAAPGFASFADRDGGDHQCRQRICPVPAEQTVEQKSDKQHAG